MSSKLLKSAVAGCFWSVVCSPEPLRLPGTVVARSGVRGISRSPTISTGGRETTGCGQWLYPRLQLHYMGEPEYPVLNTARCPAVPARISLSQAPARSANRISCPDAQLPVSPPPSTGHPYIGLGLNYTRTFSTKRREGVLTPG